MNTIPFSKIFSHSILLVSLATVGVTQNLFSQQLFGAFETIPKRVIHIRNLPSQPVCKILLDQNQKKYEVEVRGAHNVYNPYTGEKLESAYSLSSYTMTPTSDGIKWGQEFPGVYQILVVPDSQSNSMIINGIAYSGVCAFYQIDSTISVVNWVSLEDFTKSLLSSSFSPHQKDKKEALAAYAVIYRSLGYQALKKGHNEFWDIKAGDIGYKGAGIERSDKVFTDAIKNSKDIIIDIARSFPESTQELLMKSIEKIEEKMPLEEVQRLAEENKDARKILHHFFPNCSITLLQAKI